MVRDNGTRETPIGTLPQPIVFPGIAGVEFDHRLGKLYIVPTRRWAPTGGQMSGAVGANRSTGVQRLMFVLFATDHTSRKSRR